MRPLVLLFALALSAGLVKPAPAQDLAIDDLISRLPAETLVLLSWRPGADFPQIRRTNPVLRLLESPEMAANWKELQQLDGPLDDAPSDDITLDEVLTLMNNSGFIALLGPGPEAAGAFEPRVIAMYDVSGNEELLEDLDARLKADGATSRTVTWDGRSVKESVDADGVVTRHSVRIGRWETAVTDSAMLRDWLERLEASPARGLGDVSAWQAALGRDDPDAQFTLFVHLPPLVDTFLESVRPILDDTEDEEARESVALGFEILGAAAEVFGLRDWESISLRARLASDRLRYVASAAARHDDPPLLAVMAPGTADLASLAFAPPSSMSYSMTRLDPSALWGLIWEVIGAVVPPEQEPVVSGVMGMAEGMLGMPVGDLFAALGHEQAQVLYDAGREEPTTLVVQQLVNRGALLTALERIRGADLFDLMELTETGAAVPLFRLRGPPGDNGDPAFTFFAALTADWLVASEDQTVVEDAVRRGETGPSLATSPKFQRARAMFPGPVSGFGYADVDGWMQGMAAVFLQGLVEGVIAARGGDRDEDEEDDTVPIEVPDFTIPRGYASLLVTATTHDARSIRQVGIIE